MHKITKKRIELIRRILVYTLMVVSVCVTVAFITLLVLGFRFNVGDRQVEQYAFLQFGSAPSGASVAIDGVTIGSKTPSKSSVKEGSHIVDIKKDGYEPWTKEVNIKSGTLTWLNYALLVPKDLSVEPVLNFDSIYSSLPSPNNKGLIIQHSIDVPYFSLVDINQNIPKVTDLSLPAEIYSDPLVEGVVHSFAMEKWDNVGRYLLVKHIYGDKYEWLVIDTQNIALSKNISTMFNISIDNIDFSGNSGNNYFIIQSGDIRKLSINNGTISKVLVNNVVSMFVYDTNIVVFVKNISDQTKDKQIGVFREGDDSSYSIRDIPNEEDLPIRVTTAHYFNQDYVAYSVGQNVTLIGGKYPNTLGDGTKTLGLMSEFKSDGDITGLGFSPSGQYVLSKSASSISSFDIEYQNTYKSSIDCGGVNLSATWLNDNYIWSNCNNSISIREFDGTNQRVINQAISAQAVTLTHNGRYLYSIGKAESGYQLQRVRMILP